jgi:hypothetical protein
MSTKPKAGTPEYDQAMIDAHDNSVQPESELENDALASLNDNPEEEQEQEQSDSVELPEGVSMDDLLAAWKAQQEKESSEAEEGSEEQEAETEEQSEETEEEPEGEDSELERRVRELEDQLTTEKIYAAAGGKESYEKLRESVEGQLNETQQELLNVALTEGTPEQAIAAVELMQKFASMQQQSDSNINEGSLITGGKPAASKYFNSQDEMIEAMKDPRYKRQDRIGEAYRNEVLERSKFL